MASVKIVLRKKQNKDKTYPLAIRITKDRRTSFIHLGYHISEDEWDSVQQRVKKSHPNSARLNNLLIKKLAEANDKSLELETQKEEVSMDSIKSFIKAPKSTTFFTQAQLYLDNLKQSGKYNQYTADKPRIKRFREFLNKDVLFSEITETLLQRFMSYIKGTCNVNERTAINHIVVIRSVFSMAIKANVTDRKYYPFGAGKMSIKFPQSNKVGLSAEEVKKIEDVELSEGSFENHCRNLWLFSFYFAGMRVSDVLRVKWSDIQDSRLHYTMGKNNKSGSLKLPAKVTKILDQYKDQKVNKDDYIFPDLKDIPESDSQFYVQRRIAFTTSRVDKYLRNHVAPLAGIDKKLTMHIARHTFGNISGDKIPIQMLQKLYRHSSVTTTIGYQANFIHKDADDALDAVIGF